MEEQFNMPKIDYQKLNTNECKQLLDELKASGALDEYLESNTVTPNVHSLLDYDEKGKIRQSNTNCQIVLREDPIFKSAIKFNELSCRIDVTKALPWDRNGSSITDTDLDNIITYMEATYGLHVDKQIERAIRIVASENHYHPVKEKLLSLSWDGISRLPDTLHHFLGVEKTPLSTEALKIFMLGAISRVFTPGCKFEYMLCFAGGQGAGKSTFLRFLAMNDDWFTDDVKRLDDDKVFQHLQGHWITEMPEMLAVLNAKMVEETKSFISRQRDNYRTPYDKYATDHLRQCVFAGTSNKIQFLPMDKSGNRRFIPLEVNATDAEVHILDNELESRIYIEQLWAEVMTIYLSGNYNLALSKEMDRALIKEQIRFSPEDPMESAIRAYIESESPQYVCVRLLYEKALGHYSTDVPLQWESNAIGEILDQKFPEYRRISSHYFPVYKTQRAWVLDTNDYNTDFKPVSKENEADVPFIQESFL